MKTSSETAAPGPLSPEEARACLASNLGLPGLGSLMGRRFSGYPQLAMTLAGFSLSLVFGTRSAIWFFQNWSRLWSPEADPLQNWIDAWANLRWALLGIGLFAFAWLWALLTSWSIVRQARAASSH